MLLYMDLQLLPMKNSDRAWTWAGRNFAENSAGEQETLAVRFKTVDQATAFHDKIVECVRVRIFIIYLLIHIAYTTRHVSAVVI